MKLKTITLSIMMFTILFNACVSPRVDVAWPEERPLGRDLETYLPPEKPTVTDMSSLRLEEPVGKLTLRQALSLALMKNPELAAFSWEVRVNEAMALQSGLLMNPEIDVETENFGGSGDFNRFDLSETTIQLSQVIELARKPSKRRKVAELERDLSGWDYETKRLDVFTDVAKTFLDVLTAQERLAVREEMSRLAKQFYTTVFERVKAGKVSPVEETKARITLASTQIELNRAKSTLKAVRKRLASLWGSLSPNFKEVVGELDNVSPIPDFDLLISRIDQNPDLARWEAEEEHRQAALKLAKALRIPDLTLSGSVRRLNETNDHTFVFGISIPIPIFNTNQGGILMARYRLAKAEEERRSSEVKIRTLLAETYEELSASSAVVTALKKDVVPGAQSAFEAAQEGYRQGKFSFLDVLDAQRTLVEARSQYIESLNAYHISIAEIERLIGDSIDNFLSDPEQQ